MGVTYLKNSLVQLHHGNRLPETRILAIAKMCVHGVRHLFESVFRSVEPPLWAKDVGVRTPDGFGASDTVEALADFRAAGDEEAVDVVAFWRDSLEAEAADGRPHAETFADDGLEV